jgi:SUKH superfamily protein
MWRELIRDCHPALEPLGGSDPGPEFFPGATAEALVSVEQRLDVRLPDSLRRLLTETNGALVIFGTRLAWSTDEIVRRNLQMRTDPGYQERYMPFDHLLFFADAGVDGIQFAFGLIQGAIQRDDVYLWNPYDDGRPWVAPSLKTYIEWWLSGKLKV